MNTPGREIGTGPSPQFWPSANQSSQNRKCHRRITQPVAGYDPGTTVRRNVPLPLSGPLFVEKVQKPEKTLPEKLPVTDAGPAVKWTTPGGDGKVPATLKVPLKSSQRLPV